MDRTTCPKNTVDASGCTGSSAIGTDCIKYQLGTWSFEACNEYNYNKLYNKTDVNGKIKWNEWSGEGSVVKKSVMKIRAV
jgi:Fibrinogen beta and gamma chains, C-terminal globular domain